MIEAELNCQVLQPRSEDFTYSIMEANRSILLVELSEIDLGD